MGILFAFLGRAWPYILAAIAAGFIWFKADHWCNSACRDWQAKARTAEGVIKTAQQRATDLAILWAETVARAEEKAIAKEKENAAKFAKLEARLKAIPPAVASRPVDPVVVRILDDARRAANSAGPAPEPESTPAPPAADPDAASNLGLITQWATQVAQIHAECRERVAQWEQFYAGLREANQQQQK